MSEPQTHGSVSTVALISYALIALWALTVGGVFVLIGNRVAVEDVMVGILGAILSTTATGVTGVVAYWLASSALANRKDGGPTTTATTNTTTFEAPVTVADSEKP